MVNTNMEINITVFLKLIYSIIFLLFLSTKKKVKGLDEAGTKSYLKSDTENLRKGDGKYPW